MTHLAKLTFKTVDRSITRDPIIARRDKLVAGLEQQKQVLAATLNNEQHHIERSKWVKDELGQSQLIKTQRVVRPWFFAQDGGYYVQCLYGARVLVVDGNNNAVFVKTLKEVGDVLVALAAAAQAGELDAAIATVAERSSVRIPKGAANA